MGFLDKFMKKDFSSPGVQRDWAKFLKVFGSLLENAFPEDEDSRVKLVTALNKIQRKDLRDALDMLGELEGRCRSDEDRAAVYVFAGLCCETGNFQDKALEYYIRAGKYKHSYYMSYLKTANMTYRLGNFAMAAENYKSAIDCMDARVPEGQRPIILAAAYTNLAGCYTMMHRYPEASKALSRSAEVMPHQEGRPATEAVLHAVLGERKRTEALMAQLQEESPHMVEETRSIVEGIFAGTNPQFAVQPLDPALIQDFWDWYGRQHQRVTELLAVGDESPVLHALQRHFQTTFPYLERDAEMVFEPSEGHCTLRLSDFYMVSLREGYKRLWEACPAAYKSYWSWEIVH